MIISGRNPVLEAIRSGSDIDEILVRKDGDGRLMGLEEEARTRGIKVRRVAVKDLDAVTKAHRGVVAYAKEFEYATLDDIFELADKRAEDPLVIILDGIEDPHNLGAITRTANGAGVHGIIIKKHGACGVTDVVSKVSQGAIEYVPIVQVTNLATTIKELQKRGMWIAALDMYGETYTRRDLTGSLALIVGNEGKGVGRMLKERSDFILSIPMHGKISSLNASNAVAVIAYEVRRQRDAR